MLPASLSAQCLENKGALHGRGEGGVEQLEKDEAE
jgi:hypothetical protein